MNERIQYRGMGSSVHTHRKAHLFESIDTNAFILGAGFRVESIRLM